MIKRYDTDGYGDIGENDSGRFVKYEDHERYMQEYADNALDYDKWMQRIFPQAHLEVYRKNGTVLLSAMLGEINAQVETTQAEWYGKDGRMAAVQWLCKALLTELLNRCAK